MFYKVALGIVLGYLIGHVMARFLFRLPTRESIADVMGGGWEVMAGVKALATTLIGFRLTEQFGGHRFIAEFVAAHMLRHFEWEHDYYMELHDFAVIVDRLLMAAVHMLIGGRSPAGYSRR